MGYILLLYFSLSFPFPSSLFLLSSFFCFLPFSHLCLHYAGDSQNQGCFSALTKSSKWPQWLQDALWSYCSWLDGDSLPTFRPLTCCRHLNKSCWCPTNIASTFSIFARANLLQLLHLALVARVFLAADLEWVRC